MGAQSALGEGRRLAEELGDRRRDDGIAAVFSSDLYRAAQTATIAFPSGIPPILLDWRLRECDYGERNGAPADIHVRDRARYLDEPYPGGESWRQAVARVARWLDDLALRWRGARILVVGHVATRWALDQRLDGVALETLLADDFAWQEGWEYRAWCRPCNSRPACCRRRSAVDQGHLVVSSSYLTT
jgi:2,3-bisphosphoglycerate-dependent phosphoglycerate mutase